MGGGVAGLPVQVFVNNEGGRGAGEEENNAMAPIPIV